MANPTPEQIAQLLQMHNSPEAVSERLLRSYQLDPERRWVRGSLHSLSDRVWLARRSVRQSIDQVLREAIARGTDALVVADTLEIYLQPHLRPIRDAAGVLRDGQPRRVVTSMPNIRQVLGGKRPFAGSFAARRLARTEISRAHGAATDWVAARTPFAKGTRWHLSARHPEADECDRNASRDVGLGPGVSPAGEGPRYPNHPHDLCYLSIAVEEDDAAIVAELRRRYRLDEGAM